jgi:hypothetical protein
MIKAIARLFRKKARFQWKSAITGRYVKEAFALANPETTYRIRVS